MNLKTQTFLIFFVPMLVVMSVAMYVYSMLYYQSSSGHYFTIMREASQRIEHLREKYGDERAGRVLGYYDIMGHEGDCFYTDADGTPMLKDAPEWYVPRGKTTEEDGKEIYVLVGKPDMIALYITHPETGNRFWCYATVRYFYSDFTMIVVGIFLIAILSFLLSFVVYQRYLSPKLQQMTASEARMKTELDIAHRVQLQLLTMNGKLSRIANSEVYGVLYPAREVGGDLFDYVCVNDDKTGKQYFYFCIGDVSDKGAPSAMLMAIAGSLFHCLATLQEPLSDIVKAINSAFARNNKEYMFCTFFVGCMDLSTREVEYINCGHNAPLIIHGKEIVSLPVKPNLPLGLKDDFLYTTQHVSMDVDATLLLYTDGVTEAMNEKKELFGMERMRSAIQNAETVQPVVENILKAVHVFRLDAPQNDDITMLAIQVH